MYYFCRKREILDPLLDCFEVHSLIFAKVNFVRAVTDRQEMFVQIEEQGLVDTFGWSSKQNIGCNFPVYDSVCHWFRWGDIQNSGKQIHEGPNYWRRLSRVNGPRPPGNSRNSNPTFVVRLLSPCVNKTSFCYKNNQHTTTLHNASTTALNRLGEQLLVLLEISKKAVVTIRAPEKCPVCPPKCASSMAGPLSDANMTSVSRSIPSSFNVATTSPTDHAISFVMSPYGPADKTERLFSLESCPPPPATWALFCGKSAHQIPDYLFWICLRNQDAWMLQRGHVEMRSTRRMAVPDWFDCCRWRPSHHAPLVVPAGPDAQVVEQLYFCCTTCSIVWRVSSRTSERVRNQAMHTERCHSVLSHAWLLEQQIKAIHRDTRDPAQYMPPSKIFEPRNFVRKAEASSFSRSCNPVTQNRSGRPQVHGSDYTGNREVSMHPVRARPVPFYIRWESHMPCE